jgi:uncharacterized protein YeeX (DUF496 family)
VHIKLQKILQNEINENCDEDSIIQFDEIILYEIDRRLKEFISKNVEVERERKKLSIKMQSAFL